MTPLPDELSISAARDHLTEVVAQAARPLAEVLADLGVFDDRPHRRP